MLTSNQKAKLVKIHGVLCDVDGDTEPDTTTKLSFGVKRRKLHAIVRVRIERR